MKFKLDAHIIGKVYDLTQENMNEMICIIEHLVERRDKWIADALANDDKIQSLQQTVLDFQSRYSKTLERIEQLTNDALYLKVINDKYRESLAEASKYANKCDIDGRAGKIARDALTTITNEIMKDVK